MRMTRLVVPTFARSYDWCNQRAAAIPIANITSFVPTISRSMIYSHVTLHVNDLLPRNPFVTVSEMYWAAAAKIPSPFS